MSFFLNATATWTYAMYLTVQTSLHWISDNTITNVKIVRFNESNSPCLIFTFFDLGNGRYLSHCPSNWKIFSWNGKTSKSFVGCTCFLTSK